MWLLPFVYEVSTCCSGVFDIGSKLARGFCQHVRKSHQGCPRDSVQGGTPQRFRKTGRKINALHQERFKQMAAI